MTSPTALIADDEPLLRQHLQHLLGRLWPALTVVAQARSGREAVALAEVHRPDVVFLDIHMPGGSGIEAARTIGGIAHLVFVTAHEQYALQAFERGALDYLVKPLDEERLAQTVQRLQARLQGSGPALDTAALAPALEQLARALRERGDTPQRLQWIRASVGPTLRLIPVDEVIYLRSDDKYTLVVWAGGEALIRKTIRELVDELDPQVFAQTHRSVIVNLRCVSHMVRGANETAELHLRGRTETLPVSRAWLPLFRQM